MKNLKLITLITVTLLFIIGIANYINTLTTHALSRKKELALLSTIGMTKNEKRYMLSLESLSYILTALIFVLVIGNPILYFLVNASIGSEEHITVRFMSLIAPTFIMSIILIPIGLLVSSLIIRHLDKDSTLCNLTRVE